MNLDLALSLLSQTPDAPLDLAELALLLARDEYPALDVEAYLSELDGMAHEARANLSGSLTQQVKGLCRYLFHDMGFRGNQQDYYDARNSYLNEVLDRRAGIPITLAVVAVAVGRRAGLDVAGVGLPGHFVAKAVGDDEEVLFDPFHGGRLLTPKKCRLLVEQVTGIPFEVNEEALRAVPLGAIVLRMLNNLKAVYLRGGDYQRAARIIERLRQLSPHDPLQRRDLGATLFQAGQAGRAIDHLQAYLQASPKAGDADTVKQLLSQAQASVARWN
ncbi:MAG TPA: transglutaminase-like domain-containing protein [Gemmataceae bacterium]|nr:transglutaminase-like domain-containing protein [Gemmataceae bacterium]